MPDVIAPGLKVLFVDINPGRYSGAEGYHFARPGNRFLACSAQGEVYGASAFACRGTGAAAARGWHHEHCEQDDRGGTRPTGIKGRRPAASAEDQAASAARGGDPRTRGFSDCLCSAESPLRSPGGAHRHVADMVFPGSQRSEREQPVPRTQQDVAAGPPCRGKERLADRSLRPEAPKRK